MHTLSDVVATVGVMLLLVAFLANSRGILEADGSLYQGLNFLGAGLACYAAYLIGFVPFVVLEGTWCAVAGYALFRATARGPG